jgi:beta-lactamase regulating signal transducer with metallopeptidase domain
MIDVGVLQTLIVGHLWQSVAIAAVLAAVLIFGKRLRGTTRYGLAATAFLASLALPLAAFIPGETLVTAVLDRLAPNAPVAAASPVSEASAPAAEQPILRKIMLESGVDAASLDAAGRALDDLTEQGAVPASETGWGKVAVENGAPAWALNIGVSAIRRAIVPPAAEPAPQAPSGFKLPDWNLPDLSLPMLLVWIAGSLFLLVRTGRDLIAVERLVARATPIDLPLALKTRMGGVRVATSSDAPGPMAAGLLRPCVVLPERIALSSPGMAALLEHERAHIERRDMAVALLQRLTLALLWWSPALHWISRRIDEEREVACDEAAVARTGDAKAFARSLTKQAENQLWARAPKLAVGAIGPRSQVGRRIRRLIDIAKGVSPAKYSGRLAFAGLALAVAVAAMVTPRVPADAQQQTQGSPAVEEPLAGQPRDPQAPARGRTAQLPDRDDLTLDGGNDDFASLGEEIGRLMESVGAELEFAFADLSPELEAELEGLSAEMAALGVEISAAVSQEVLEQMPEIMAQVREALEAEGIDIDDLDGFSEADREDLRRDLREAREELRQALGPEMQAEIRKAIEEARLEVAEHRDEIAAAIAESQASMAIARDVMAKVRAELEAARLRGDFKPQNFDFNFDLKEIEKLHGIKVDADKIQAIRIKGEAWGEAGKLAGAAGRCDEDEVRALLAGKADVNATVPGGRSALFSAAQSGCEDTVQLLLNAGADVNHAPPGQGSALYYAVKADNDEMASLLLRAGAEVDKGAPGAGSPLVAAVKAGEEDMVRLLLDAGADANAKGPGTGPVLANAVQAGRDDIVRMLVEKGADVNARSNTGRSPLDIAERSGNRDLADYLRSRGAVASPERAN